MVTVKDHRYRNRQEMTIVEQLNDISKEICDKYCKYPELCKETEDDLEEAQNLLDRMYCANCPFNRI